MRVRDRWLRARVVRGRNRQSMAGVARGRLRDRLSRFEVFREGSGKTVDGGRGLWGEGEGCRDACGSSQDVDKGLE